MLPTYSMVINGLYFCFMVSVHRTNCVGSDRGATPFLQIKEIIPLLCLHGHNNV